jgi:HEPN domain-containing protein
VPRFYHKLYDAAKLDGLSAEILNKNNLHAPAIYHCAQAVEKCLKATHAYHLFKIEKKSEDEIGEEFSSRGYRHDLRESYKEYMKFLLELYVDNIVKDNKKQAYEQIRHRIYIPVLGISHSIRQFDELVGILYDDYIEIKKGNFEGFDADLELKTRELLDKEYFRYMILVMRLSAFLTPFEEYSRYPKKEFSYNNIFLLNNARNKLAIHHICVMIDDALNLVPSLWIQLAHYFKSKINN